MANDLVMTAFVFCFGIVLSFYVFFFILAMPLFRKHGITPRFFYSSLYVNEDLETFASLLAAEDRPLTPYYVLVIIKYACYLAFVLFVFIVLRSCSDYDPKKQYEILKNMGSGRFQ